MLNATNLTTHTDAVWSPRRPTPVPPPLVSSRKSAEPSPSSSTPSVGLPATSSLLFPGSDHDRLALGPWPWAPASLCLPGWEVQWPPSGSAVRGLAPSLPPTVSGQSDQVRLSPRFACHLLNPLRLPPTASSMACVRAAHPGPCRGTQLPHTSWKSVSSSVSTSQGLQLSTLHPANSSGPKGASCPPVFTVQPTAKWLHATARTDVAVTLADQTLMQLEGFPTKKKMQKHSLKN